jgi:hypothetical protein
MATLNFYRTENGVNEIGRPQIIYTAKINFPESLDFPGLVIATIKSIPGRDGSANYWRVDFVDVSGAGTFWHELASAKDAIEQHVYAVLAKAFKQAKASKNG